MCKITWAQLLLIILIFQCLTLCFITLRSWRPSSDGKVQHHHTTASAEVTAESPYSDDFSASLSRVLQQQRSNSCLYTFNSSLQLPLLRLDSPAELDQKNRVQAAAAWLCSSVDVVFAASVRNAMRGLPSTAQQMQRLAQSFRSAAFVFVENDSSDGTRHFLANWRRNDSRVHLLGCGGTDAPCRMNISYSSGRAHHQGWSMRRSEAEKIERSVVMSALRNIYLRYIYRHFYQPDRETLLIVVDADITFHAWDLDAILQGLHYFRDRPTLQSVCAHTRHYIYGYDMCTLAFHPDKVFSEAPKESPVIKSFRTKSPPPGLPPVKVFGCFQAVTAYRLSHLAKNRIEYGPAHGESTCEHLTLSKQLTENYLDLNMKLSVFKQNEGNY
ncbi:hypothetical protein BOX15_Mlig016746g2 [Macrostomum lignano]|uniref:Uncharacterized protein n=1 Tax=Macrostomum lignano TaxID=282301 RepID=A0A267EKX6_9PLAT|nr:hypothetical protein BOX15_Mlig016746g2 [Macrostomum lignano]